MQRFVRLVYHATGLIYAQLRTTLYLWRRNVWKVDVNFHSRTISLKLLVRLLFFHFQFSKKRRKLQCKNILELNSSQTTIYFFQMKGMHLIVKDTDDLQTNELRHEHFCPFHPFPTEPVQRHSEIRHHKTSPNTNYSNTSNEAGTWQGGGVFMLNIRSFMWWNTWLMKCNVRNTTRF